MTNFFGVNITKDQESSEIDGNVFLKRTVSFESSEKIESFSSSMEEAEKKIKLPKALSVVKTICLIAWLIVLNGIIGSDVSFAQGYRNAPFLHWTGLVCLILWLSLLIYGRFRRRSNHDLYNNELELTAEEIISSSCQELGIPEKAVSVDVFAERYVIKSHVPKHRNIGPFYFINLEVSAFTDNGCLYLADLEHLWEIDLRSLKSAEFVKKPRNFPEWHKSQTPKSEEYKKFNVAYSNTDGYFSKYYRVEISDVRGDFYLLIPEYDWENFSDLTNLRQHRTKLA